MSSEQLHDAPQQHHDPAPKLDDIQQDLKAVRQFSTHRVSEVWKEQFDSHDKAIGQKEFNDMMTTLLNLHSPEHDYLLNSLFVTFDTNNNGKIEYKELVTAFSILSTGQPEEKVEMLFRLMDLNGDGKISREEFSKVVEALWENDRVLNLIRFASEEARLYGLNVFVRHIFEESDPTGTGFLDLNKFDLKKYVRFGKPTAIMEGQTGGHVGAFVIPNPGQVQKKVNEGEFIFYTQQLPKLSGIECFVPKYFGCKSADESEDGKNHVIMEDLTFGYEKPCILDLKMGVTSEVGADPEKLKRCREKDEQSTTKELGMRFTGMRVYRSDTDGFERFNKSWGFSLTPDNFNNGLMEFFTTNPGDKPHLDLIPQYLDPLKQLQQWMNSQSQYKFISSSLLFVYDGADPSKGTRLRMIDFAHVLPLEDEPRDEGYLFGLNNLIERLGQLTK